MLRLVKLHGHIFKNKMNFFKLLLLAILVVGCQTNQPKKETSKSLAKQLLTQQESERLVELPLKCVEQEYPNKLMQVLNDSSDLHTPKELHPAFYGCFDWHSSVHGHWLMISLLNRYPQLKNAEKIRKYLNRQLTAENIEAEIHYFQQKQNSSFERTYGWAWLLKLQQELLNFKDSDAQQWANNLQPLADLIVEKYLKYLPKLNYPLRSGDHINTAFGLTFAHDYAIFTKQNELQKTIEKRAKDFYLKDIDVPYQYEPSGYDFLSPSLETVDLMRRVLPKDEFFTWLKDYFPDLLENNFDLEVGLVSDRSDGHMVHLDGLNFSRAWCFYQLADYDKAFKHLYKVADKHLMHSLPSIVDGDYMGEHWLASFALNALIAREK